MENIKQERWSENTVHMVKFFLFSLSAGAIQAISFAILYSGFKLLYWPSYLVALILSVIWNFTLNRKFTFKSAANIPLAMTKVAIYYAIFTPLSTWWGQALDNIWHFPLAGYVILIGTMITNLITEFIVQKYIVYHNHINTAVQDNK